MLAEVNDAVKCVAAIDCGLLCAGIAEHNFIWGINGGIYLILKKYLLFCNFNFCVFLLSK